MIYPEHITSTNHNYTAPLRILISHREIAEFLWLLTDLEAYWWGLHPIQHVIEKLLEEAIFLFSSSKTLWRVYIVILTCFVYLTICVFWHPSWWVIKKMKIRFQEHVLTIEKRICRVKVALKKLKIWIHFKEAVQSYKACFH